MFVLTNGEALCPRITHGSSHLCRSQGASYETSLLLQKEGCSGRVLGIVSSVTMLSFWMFVRRNGLQGMPPRQLYEILPTTRGGRLIPLDMWLVWNVWHPSFTSGIHGSTRRTTCMRYNYAGVFVAGGGERPKALVASSRKKTMRLRVDSPRSNSR